MYTDKWLYRSEFVKLRKNLYRNLKASEAKTEAQRNRLKYVKAFKSGQKLIEVRKWSLIFASEANKSPPIEIVV
ncbi:hypothetical protein DVH24_017171 [Malus domestica]|uniref:Uncharacterized protein n=1 Tax=Malus domestica TaxID=3750 RepID=A0A498IRN0_MALDO|nr:hypothetical protein DVH24_017171 [Malus domestica]